MHPDSDLIAELAAALRENDQLKNSLASLETALKHAEKEAHRNLTAAQAANEQLQYFVYAASHDLQEPLRTVVTYAQLLERQYPNDEQAREFTGFIASGVDRMTSLLQNLLFYCKVGSSPNRRSEIKLNIPLQWALLKLAGPVRDSGAIVTPADLPELYVDEAEMAQVFYHLISNSLKFHSQNTPEIVIAAEQGSDACTISVRDNGTGIEPAYQAEVLKPFKRLHGKGIPGNGLGLAICSKIVNAHGGRLWVESDGRNGSTVRFTLPIS